MSTKQDTNLIIDIIFISWSLILQWPVHEGTKNKEHKLFFCCIFARGIWKNGSDGNENVLPLCILKLLVLEWDSELQNLHLLCVWYQTARLECTSPPPPFLFSFLTIWVVLVKRSVFLSWAHCVLFFHVCWDKNEALNLELLNGGWDY